MHRRTYLAMTLCLLLAAASVSAQDKAESKPAESDRKSTWHDCKPGSYARYRIVTTLKEDGATRQRIVIVTYLVKQWTEDGVGVEITTRVQGKSSANTRREFVPHNIDNSPIVQDPSVKLGADDVDVPAGKFSCRWAQETHGESITRVYVNDKVPGHYVKSVQKRESGFVGSTVMELLSYSKK